MENKGFEPEESQVTPDDAGPATNKPKLVPVPILPTVLSIESENPEVVSSSEHKRKSGVKRSRGSKKITFAVPASDTASSPSTNDVIVSIAAHALAKIPNTSQLNLSPLNDLLGSTISFHLTSKYPVCCPTMQLTPLQTISTTQANLKELFCRCSNYCTWLFCCNSQTISICNKDGEKALSFIYSPNIWCPANNEDRYADVFLATANERLGWVEAGRDFAKGTRVTSALTSEIFLTRKVEEKGTPYCFKIENSSGNEVCSGRVTTVAWLNGIGIKKWSGFQFDFVPSELDALSHATRAVLLVAFLLWVIDCREKKQWTYIWTFLFIAFLAVCFLLIQLQGGE